MIHLSAAGDRTREGVGSREIAFHQLGIEAAQVAPVATRTYQQPQSMSAPGDGEGDRGTDEAGRAGHEHRTSHAAVYTPGCTSWCRGSAHFALRTDPPLRTIPILLALAGLAIVTVIVGWLGAGHVVRAMLSVGLAGFAAVLAIQLALYAVLAQAWHVACPSVPRSRLLLGRMVREAGTTCLPFAHLGGIAFGMQAITGPGADLPRAFAASVIDVTLETIAQIAFIALGLLALEATSDDHRFRTPLAVGLLLMALGVGGFVWLQRDGGRLVRRVFATVSRHIARQWRSMALHGMDAIQHGLEQAYDHKGRMAVASVMHLLAWIGGAGWTWFVYRALGASVAPAEALAIEGVVSGALTLSFLVPGNLGVQEAAYVALGSLFGIGAELSLGLSLLRRAKDLAIGVPVLLLWQGLELRRARPVRLRTPRAIE